MREKRRDTEGWGEGERIRAGEGKRDMKKAEGGRTKNNKKGRERDRKIERAER